MVGRILTGPSHRVGLDRKFLRPEFLLARFYPLTKSFAHIPCGVLSRFLGGWWVGEHLDSNG